jgi:hypothetical protein
MVNWQLSLIIIGVLVILTGIGIGNLSPPPQEVTQTSLNVNKKKALFEVQMAEKPSPL